MQLLEVIVMLLLTAQNFWLRACLCLPSYKSSNYQAESMPLFSEHA